MGLVQGHIAGWCGERGRSQELLEPGHLPPHRPFGLAPGRLIAWCPGLNLAKAAATLALQGHLVR